MQGLEQVFDMEFKEKLDALVREEQDEIANLKKIFSLN